ncbi:hypothetical protein HHK36_025051 [Tetracentron sinense]|uniref:Cytochrome P450 n=1 Tax=Tetracentron sinense TaxID=13715 RepID=A0A834YK52_TETSI|nr:hypothetical protein HHK36_025051 [Tetracentron sinense]
MVARATSNSVPCLVSLSSLLLSSLLNLSRARRHNFPPSPTKLPIIGNLHQLGKLPHRSLRALSEKYGSLMLLHFGHVPILVVSSAEMAREIMKTHDIAFANRPMTTAADAFLYGGRDVAFSPYGEFWRQMRKISSLELLSLKRVQSAHFIRGEEVGLMIEKISRSCSSGTTVNLSEMLLTVYTNIICRTVLGRKFEEEKEEGKNKFGEMSKEAMVLLGAFSFGDFFPSLKWMDVLTGLAARLNRTSRALDAFFDQVIEEHLISCRRDDDEDDNKKDFVDILLHVQKSSMLDINLTRADLKATIQVSLSLSLFS